jgi:CRISPR system Cascade subunit CasC
MVQNHVPANLNRDDLGAPKSAYFGGVLRARISSQCLKRSIRRSDIFAPLCGGIRTRRLAELISGGEQKLMKKAQKTLEALGLESTGKKKGNKSEEDEKLPSESKLAVYLPAYSISRLQELIRNADDQEFRNALEEELTKSPLPPDVALFGRMLETTELSDTKVEAACQVAHALSTHESIPEVDYFTAVDDVPGADAGAAFLDEAGYVSACFYKFFSIDLNQLVKNLTPKEGSESEKLPAPEKLAANTVVTFIRAAALSTPSGKRNAFAHFDPPAAIIVELRDFPLNYANAFAKPIPRDSQSLVAESVACLMKFAEECRQSFNAPSQRYVWILQAPYAEDLPQLSDDGTTHRVNSFDELLAAVANSLGYTLDELRDAVLPENMRCDNLLRNHAANKLANQSTAQE